MQVGTNELKLTGLYPTLRDVIAAGVYRRGVNRVAALMNMAPSGLSMQLSGAPNRHFSIDALVQYMQVTGDLTPLLWLNATFLGSYHAKIAEKTRTLHKEILELQDHLSQVGAK